MNLVGKGIGGGTMEKDVDLSPSVRQTKLNHTFDRISTLMADLEEKEETADIYYLKSTVEDLMYQFSENQVGMYADLSTLLQSLKAGMMSPEQMENLIKTEQERSKFILHAANVIRSHLGYISENFQKLFHNQETPQIPTEAVKAHVCDLNLVMDQVETISKVINTPATRLTRSAMNVIEADLRAKSKKVENANEITKLPDNRLKAVDEDKIEEDQPIAPLMTNKKAKALPPAARILVLNSTKNSGAPSPSVVEERPFSPAYFPPDVKKITVDIGCQTDRVVEKKERASTIFHHEELLAPAAINAPILADSVSVTDQSIPSTSAPEPIRHYEPQPKTKKSRPKSKEKSKAAPVVEPKLAPQPASRPTTTVAPAPAVERPVVATEERKPSIQQRIIHSSPSSFTPVPAPAPVPATAAPAPAPAPVHAPPSAQSVTSISTPPVVLPHPAEASISSDDQSHEEYHYKPRPSANDVPSPLSKPPTAPAATNTSLDGDSKETARLKQKVRTLEDRVRDLEAMLATKVARTETSHAAVRQQEDAQPLKAAARSTPASQQKRAASSFKKPGVMMRLTDKEDDSLSNLTFGDNEAVGDKVKPPTVHVGGYVVVDDNNGNDDGPAGELLVVGESFDALEPINNMGYNPHTSHEPLSRGMVYSAHATDNVLKLDLGEGSMDIGLAMMSKSISDQGVGRRGEGGGGRIGSTGSFDGDAGTEIINNYVQILGGGGGPVSLPPPQKKMSWQGVPGDISDDDDDGGGGDVAIAPPRLRLSRFQDGWNGQQGQGQGPGQGQAGSPSKRQGRTTQSPPRYPPPRKEPLRKMVPTDVKIFFRPEMSTKETSTDDLIRQTSPTANSGDVKSGTKVEALTVAVEFPDGDNTARGATESSRPMTDSCFDTDPFQSKKASTVTSGAVIDKRVAGIAHFGAVATAATDDDLPLVSQVDGLVVRSYRKPVPRGLKEDLLKAENPLLLLYEEFAPCLPDVLKMKLLTIASGVHTEEAVSSTLRASSRKAHAHYFGLLSQLDSTAGDMVMDANVCDKILDVLESIKGARDVNMPADVFRNSVQNLYKKLGELEAKTLFVEVQLSEFRRFVEEINTIGLTAFPVLLKTCKEFNAAHDVFLSCQGKMVVVKNRHADLKSRCKRNQIPSLDWNPAMCGSSGDVTAEMRQQQQQQQQQIVADAAQLEQLRYYVDNLRKQLAASREEVEDLSVELFRVSQELDRTPAALQFFSALLDPSTIPSLQQLQLQLGALRGFTNCSEHLDFPTVRKRLTVCVSTIPTLERFVQRFASLHTKWTHARLNVFKNRHESGGDADGSHTCPLCNVDRRQLVTSGVQSAQKPLSKSASGPVGTGAQPHRYSPSISQSSSSSLSGNTPPPPQSSSKRAKQAALSRQAAQLVEEVRASSMSVSSSLPHLASITERSDASPSPSTSTSSSASQLSYGTSHGYNSVNIQKTSTPPLIASISLPTLRRANSSFTSTSTPSLN